MTKETIVHNFTTCPNCGGVHTLANDVLQTQIEKGAMPKESKAFIFQHQSVIARATGWLSAPLVITFFDVCSDCGTTYCVHAEEKVIINNGNVPKSNGKFS
jgi:hypothetical protein